MKLIVFAAFLMVAAAQEFYEVVPPYVGYVRYVNIKLDKVQYVVILHNPFLYNHQLSST